MGRWMDDEPDTLIDYGRTWGNDDERDWRDAGPHRDPPEYGDEDFCQEHRCWPRDCPEGGHGDHDEEGA